MSKYSVMTVVGSALMAWGGASITAGLGFTDWRQVNVALFAIGIILLAQAPYLQLRSRICELEGKSRLPSAIPPSAS